MEYLAIILVSISVIAYAVLVGYTLYIANQQRKNAKRPYLVLQKMNLYIYWKKMGDGFLFSGIWSQAPIADEKPIVHGIDFINIGQGPAVDIVVEWSVDVERFIEIVKAQDMDKVFRFDYDGKKLSVEIRLPLEKHPTMGFKWLNNESREVISHVLPFHLDKKPTRIITHKTYLFLLSVYYYLMYINKSYEILEILYAKLPECIARIKYRDVEGNRYYTEQSISFSVVEHNMYEVATERGLVLEGLLNHGDEANNYVLVDQRNSIRVK